MYARRGSDVGCPREASLQEILEPDLGGWPVVPRKGVVHRVANEAIAHDRVAAQDSVAHSTESFHGALRSKISCVSIQLDSVCQKRFKGVMEH
jgi:hypothetical protein